MKNYTLIFTIYDKVAEESGGLFEAKNEATAIRMFKNFLKNDIFAKTDYKLMLLGIFNKEINKIESKDPEELIVQWSPAELGEN
ncbi:nonstructural protein [Tortoise microvirus 30]|nr:nonstructural protein [Tortoise microvirus 30]